MSLFRVIFIYFFCVFVAQSAYSQVVVIPSTNKVEIEGRSYFLHDVKQGETLFSISKAYNVQQKDIILINPNASETIKIGEELKIPIYEIHTVKRGETLFSISKRYEVSLNEFFILNPEIDPSKLKLSVGQKIKIPLPDIPPIFAMIDEIPQQPIVEIAPPTIVVPEPTVSQQPVVEIREPKPKSKYRVAMFLPLFVDNNFPSSHSDSLLIKDSNEGYRHRSGRYWINPLSVNGLEFYQGALIALDTLKKQGLNAQIVMFDTKRDTAIMAQILESPEMKDIDLIIGPFTTELVDMVKDYATENKIYYVSPTAINVESLKNNPFLIQVNGGEINTVTPIVDFLSTQENIHITLIGNKSRFDQTLYNSFRNRLKAVFPEDKITEHFMRTDSMQAPHRYLRRGVTNVIIIPDDDEPFVNLITGQLNVSSTTFRINVYGPSRWTKFVNLDLDYLHALEFRYASAFFIDNEKPEVKRFLQQYSQMYHTEPAMITSAGAIFPFQYHFAYLGYDITYFFLSALKKYGATFGDFLSDFRLNTLQSDYYFERIDPVSGYKNSNFQIYKYTRDYTIVKEEPKIEIELEPES